jgi:hypothetical protein
VTALVSVSARSSLTAGTSVAAIAAFAAHELRSRPGDCRCMRAGPASATVPAVSPGRAWAACATVRRLQARGAVIVEDPVRQDQRAGSDEKTSAEGVSTVSAWPGIPPRATGGAGRAVAGVLAVGARGLTFCAREPAGPIAAGAPRAAGPARAAARAAR